MSAPNSPPASRTSYLCSVQGICKITEILLGITAGCLVGIGFVGTVVYFFSIVVGLACIYALVYLFFLMNGQSSEKWHKEFASNIFLAIIYVIASAMAFYYGAEFQQTIAGGAIGVLCAVVHLVDAGDIYRKNH